MKSLGVAHNLDLVQFGSALGPRGTRTNNFQQGHEVACRIFEGPRNNWPDGVLILNDEMTQGAMLGLQKLGMRVPEDVMIATHANRGSWVLHGHEDRLVLLEFDSGELVQNIFGLLETLIHGKEPERRNIQISPQLRIGKAVLQRN